MIASVLVDTNVLVYAYDRAAPQKQRQALDTLDYLAIHGSGALSTQVLAEFFVAITRKIISPLSAADAYIRLEHLLLAYTVLESSGLIVLEAARGTRDYQMHFWDAQIWATARLNQITCILSEDFNTGSVIEGVRFVNPFAPDFQIVDWAS
ncbi:MAG TPA: PIN domain-containing protein [Roseiflexaceae bacterium]|nr:PIN domain-containing protein [Roseiflexaceae bacterium]